MPNTTQAMLDSLNARADDILAARLRREEAQLEAEQAAQRQAAREQARANAERNREYQARYADAFSAFGTEAPAPIDDETPFAYRRRLFTRLQHRLGADHDLAEIRSDELSGPAMRNFEIMIIDASKAEGLKPSFQNLPADGTLVSRTRIDADTGEKSTHFYGRSSFIKDMGREGRRVLRLMDPKTRSVLLGAPFSREG
jgi:hypothetical protein